MAAPRSALIVNERPVVRGLKAVGANLSELTDLHRRVANAVLPIYRSRIPATDPHRKGRARGRLRDSARIGATRTRALVRVGGGDIEYAQVVTFGWPGHGIAPNRWDIPATAIAGRVALPLYEAGIKQVIAKHGAGPV